MCRRKGKPGGKETKERGEINSPSHIACLFTFCFHSVLQLLSEENNLNTKAVRQHAAQFAGPIISTHQKELNQVENGTRTGSIL